MSLRASFILLAIFNFKSTNLQFVFPGNQQQNHNNQRPRQSNQLGFFPQQQNLFPQNNFGFPNFQNFQNVVPQNQQNNNNRPSYQQQPNNQQQNYQQQQFNRPQTNRPVSQSTITQTTVRPVQTTQQTFDRVSQRKCDEYAKLIKRRFQVASLSLDAAPQDISITQCDAVTGLVVGGIDANPGEFPHMAAIGYPDFNGDLSFKCGGSLISEYFVLTAAHCSKADRTKPSVVRLGGHNLAVKDKNLQEIEISIEKFINHEAYNSDTRENDIALVKLAQQVVFNKLLRPACLQQSENIGKSKAIATGWGYTEVGGTTSDILQKVQLDIIANQQCSALYNDEDNYHIFSSQICAGVLKGGKDTCGGDSGGPLQVPIGNECVFSIIGLTSYGSSYCGHKNSPGIYTRVSSYVSWIESKVWPQ